MGMASLYKFVGDPDDDLKCLICLDVSEDSLQHKECGKLLCRACLEKYGVEKPCPYCRKEKAKFTPDNYSKCESWRWEREVICMRSERMILTKHLHTSFCLGNAKWQPLHP